jgi:hypothetical protein
MGNARTYGVGKNSLSIVCGARDTPLAKKEDNALNGAKFLFKKGARAFEKWTYKDEQFASKHFTTARPR